MPKEVTRYINPDVTRELWVRAGGRCQFDGHNELLYKSPITQESVNIAQQAHIYSFSENGPRGWGPFKKKPKGLNEVDNLMLMCHTCHKLIDDDKEGVKYSAELLLNWKKAHESRIVTVTGIASNKKSHVVFYGSNIGEQKSPIQKYEAMSALFPDHYPASDNPITLSMNCSHEDCDINFWQTEIEHQKKQYYRIIEPLLSDVNLPHFSLFALAPIPLLIYLGCLFTDKTDVDTYQLIREPKGWKWQDLPIGFEFIVERPKTTSGKPALIISISDKINYSRITDVLGDNVSIWEITVPPELRNNDNIRSKKQLSMFRTVMRKLIGDIKEVHGLKTSLLVFPSMGVSCSIEFGRIRMPKADMPWVIYDQNNKNGKFIEAITIGEFND